MIVIWVVGALLPWGIAKGDPKNLENYPCAARDLGFRFSGKGLGSGVYLDKTYLFRARSYDFFM